MEYKKSDCEYLRLQANTKFDRVKETWIECGRWAAPHRTSWLLSQDPGQRSNYHIVDGTHILALRSFQAGFLEGNTSASRPWYKTQAKNPDLNHDRKSKEWLFQFDRRQFSVLASSNFYDAAGQFYEDFGVFNTAAYYIDELATSLYFHVLVPGSYKVINNRWGEAVVLVREFRLNIKALVEGYGKKDKNGRPDWSNFSSRVKKLYEEGCYTEQVDVCQIVKENEFFNPAQIQAGYNRKWVSLTYEMATIGAGTYADGSTRDFEYPISSADQGKFLEVKASRRKPFIVGTSKRTGSFEYGQKGPTLDSLGCIKSLNKKAIGKDQALELMLKPPVQGPASLRRSYVSTNARTFVPLDANSAKQGGLKPVFEINPAIAAVIQDVQDLRDQVEKFYYADYLLYLSRNPKTRTAAETNAVVQEQQLIIGPNLQSLNFTHNEPVVEYTMDYVLDKDPYLEEPPDDLAGQFLRPEFISVFAQAQKAADLPAVDRFVAMVEQVGQLNPKIWDKVDVDNLAEIYNDRLYLPPGLVVEQTKVDAQREQAQMMQQRQQMLEQTLPAMAGAAKDVGIKAPPQGGGEQQ